MICLPYTGLKVRFRKFLTPFYLSVVKSQAHSSGERNEAATKQSLVGGETSSMRTIQNIVTFRNEGSTTAYETTRTNTTARNNKTVRHFTSVTQSTTTMQTNHASRNTFTKFLPANITDVSAESVTTSTSSALIVGSKADVSETIANTRSPVSARTTERLFQTYPTSSTTAKTELTLLPTSGTTAQTAPRNGALKSNVTSPPNHSKTIPTSSLNPTTTTATKPKNSNRTTCSYFCSLNRVTGGFLTQCSDFPRQRGRFATIACKSIINFNIKERY